MPPTPYIETAGLTYTYPRAAAEAVLREVTLAIGRRDRLVIAGPSGSGKSTLCRTFNGLIPHFHGGRLEGVVRVNGRSVARQSVADLFDKVGMVFQNPEAQLFNRTVRREIAFGLESLGLPPQTMAQRIADTAAALELAPLLERHPHTLSGGEKHLAAMAAVLALQPAVLVLDEPYASLDAGNARRLRQALERVHGGGTGLVVCEHRLAQAADGATHLAVLDRGRLVRHSPVDAVGARELTDWGLDAPGGEPLPETSPEIPRPPGQVPEAARQPLLTVADLEARENGRLVLVGVSFHLEAGECVALIGPNGAGKTTLLRHLNGLRHPARGSVRLLGADIRRRPTSALARHVGMAFQNPDSQFFRLRVRDEIAAGPLALGCHDPEWVRRLVALFGLERYLERAPYRLSGGEKRRVAFAAALAANPAVLALDEPTAGQDRFFRQRLQLLLAALREAGRGVLLATHDLPFAAACAQRWVLLAGGRVQAQGTPARLLADAGAMAAIGVTPDDLARQFAPPGATPA